MRRLLLILLPLLAVAAACGSEGTETAGPALDDIVAPTAGGGQIEFNSLEGTDTVLWFWAPW